MSKEAKVLVVGLSCFISGVIVGKLVTKSKKACKCGGDCMCGSCDSHSFDFEDDGTPDPWEEVDGLDDEIFEDED